MDMIEQEIQRLKIREQELSNRIIPDFERRTQMLYGQILPLQKDSEARLKLEAEYTQLSRELTIRSDELINIRHQIQNLDMEKNFRR